MTDDSSYFYILTNGPVIRLRNTAWTVEGADLIVIDLERSDIPRDSSASVFSMEYFTGIVFTSSNHPYNLYILPDGEGYTVRLSDAGGRYKTVAAASADIRGKWSVEWLTDDPPAPAAEKVPYGG
jgi:hypothetical protein